jgi:archaellum biogenesis protein FlaJ (TadC family)
MKKKIKNKKNWTFIAITIIFAIIIFFLKGALEGIMTIIILPVLMKIFFTTKIKLESFKKIKKMEEVFPDFLQLVTSNLKAGMTIDKSILLSSRKEFSPLDEEITKLGKDIVTGKPIEEALIQMSKRTNSEKIKKTMEIIISGIKSGGDIATLLEQTSANLKERNYVEKKSSSNVLTYVIFIFFAVAVGSPVLFSLSTILVEVLKSILSNIPVIETNFSLPFTLTNINISPEFITYFSIVFLITTSILGSLIIGLVRKGSEKEGIKYIIPIISLSLTIFFIVRKVLRGYFSSFVSG